MKRLSIAVLVVIFCVVQSVPVPQPEESIDLVNIPLSNNKVSAKLFIPSQIKFERFSNSLISSK